MGLCKVAAMDLGIWMVTGALVLALGIFVVGWIWQLTRSKAALGEVVESGTGNISKAFADSPYAPPAFGIGIQAPPLPQPPPLSGPQRKGWWKVSSAPYRFYDLPLMAFIAGVYCLPLVMQAVATGNSEAGAASPAGEVGVGEVLATVVFQFFMVALVLGCMAKRVSLGRWLGLEWRLWPMVFVISPLAVGLTWGVVGVMQESGFISWLESMTGNDGRQEVVKAFTEAQSPVLLVLLSAMAVVVAPLTEEVLFRGYLYPVAKRFVGRLPAILFGSLIFAVAHNNAMALIPLFTLGVLLTLAYEFTGSLWAPISIHVLFNGLTVAVQIAIRNGWVEVPGV